MKKKIVKPTLKKVIEQMGGITSLADHLKVAPSSVCCWLYTDRLVPEKAAKAIKKYTDIELPAKDIRIRKITKPFLVPLIKKAGGAQSFAEAMGMHVSLVSKLLHTPQKVGPQYVIKLSRLSQGSLKPHQIRPDLFDEE
jgi:DNA-binding transcriptional regulator YdaS (Cro superfamily)